MPISDSQFNAFLRSGEEIRVLLELDYYLDPSIQKLYFANGYYVDNTVQRVYKPRIVGDVSFQSSLPSGEMIGLSQASWSSISLKNQDGDLDYLSSLNADFLHP